MFAFRNIGLAAALVATGATAQQYPTKSITMLVPYAAGGPTDTVARVVAQHMLKPLGQTVIVENKPSAGGILAPEQVKNAKADGYTILIHHVGMATTPALYRQLRFNPLTDFEYIGLINDVPMTLIAKPTMPAKDFKEFLAYIKANKDKVSYANAGIGKLATALQDTVKDESVKKRFAYLGATTYPPEKATPAALQAHLKAEIDKWTPLIKKAGVYAD